MTDRDDRSRPSDPDVRVSVVVVSWNALATVKECFPSVAQTARDDIEIIFVDNGSTDGSADWIADTYPSMRLVRLDDNLGYCAGNNRGAAVSRGDILVLLNNDVEVPPDWLDGLLHSFAADARVGAVQPCILDRARRGRFEYAGAAGGFLDRHGYPFARGRLFFTIESDHGQYDDATDVFWATGAALATRRDLYMRLGGFDERLEMHMEEIDYCWRLQRAGYRVVCEPSSRVYHIGAASLSRASTRKVYLNYRNNLLVLFKNLPDGTWYRLLAGRVLLDGLGMLRALALFRPAEAWAILRAYAAARRMRSLFKSDRPDPGEQRVFPPYRGSVVVDYFLLGRKTFDRLPNDRFTEPGVPSVNKEGADGG